MTGGASSAIPAGGAGIDAQIAETRTGIERGMAALQLAGGQPCVEVEARLF